MNWAVTLDMIGLAVSAAGFTALVGYAMCWAAWPTAILPAEVVPTSVAVDGHPVDVAVLVAIDSRMRWVDLAEDEREADGRRKLVTSGAGATPTAVRRRRHAGRVTLTWPKAHA